MKKVSYFVFFFQFLYLILFFNSCVSFNFDTLKDQKAKGVIFQAPSHSYEKTIKTGMDASWENKENNNTLSFFSNCSFATRVITLKQFQKELLAGLKTFHMMSQKETRHQGQKAYYSHLSQFNVKEQAMKMELFLFKKEKCFYVLNFLRPVLKKGHSDQIQVFENFIREFRAP